MDPDFATGFNLVRTPSEGAHRAELSYGSDVKQAPEQLRRIDLRAELRNGPLRNAKGITWSMHEAARQFPMGWTSSRACQQAHQQLQIDE
jgi:hypothetical protein